ncbi:hypothetical protein EVAR_100696_1 [Eumeta japonica]|uniref:Uncharacterized protein n=1 Tax=Eumeta variegata TaxID=151549 RepID=A0A4C1T2I3_EUMVA|nr:hypothetical protein EVAR_100696_1 [Eumeta japonica]
MYVQLNGRSQSRQRSRSAERATRTLPGQSSCPSVSTSKIARRSKRQQHQNNANKVLKCKLSNLKSNTHKRSMEKLNSAQQVLSMAGKLCMRQYRQAKHKRLSKSTPVSNTSTRLRLLDIISKNMLGFVNQTEATFFQHEYDTRTCKGVRNG